MSKTSEWTYNTVEDHPTMQYDKEKDTTYPVKEPLTSPKQNKNHWWIEHILRLSIIAMKDTIGPNRRIPRLLLFGVLPSFPYRNMKTPNKRELVVAL